MNAEAKAKWVAALRSGKYKQGKRSLRPTEDTFCCLGVCLDVNKPNWIKVGETSWQYEGSVPLDLYPRQIYEYVLMNDQEGKTFEEIADYVEANE